MGFNMSSSEQNYKDLTRDQISLLGLTEISKLPDNASHSHTIANKLAIITQNAKIAEEFAKADQLEAVNTALTEHLEANPVSIPIIDTVLTKK